MAIDLSMLDLANVAEGETSAQALNRTLTLATRAEAAGAHRFWVAEHHNMDSVASTSPPVIMAALAARTSTMKVGSGGVMLPNHAPYAVAEQFAALEALYPHRIDLGLGRAPGTDMVTARALRRDTEQLGAEEFPQHVLELMSWFGDNRLEDPLSARLKATPNAESHPEIWILGSSDYGARLAGMLGVRYCYAAHFGQYDPFAVLEAYRKTFKPSPALDAPHAMVCTSAITADTAEEAEFLAGPAKVMALGMRQNKRGPIVSPDKAAEVTSKLTELDEMMLDQLPATKFVGTHDDVAERLARYTDHIGAAELMLTATTHDVATKAETFEAISRRW